MSIVGIGTDMVHQPRINAILARFGRRFASRILSADELNLFDSLTYPEAFLAKRFAAKEAIAKALGTGIGIIRFNQISVTNLPNGKPIVNFTTEALTIVHSLGVQQVMISLSDEQDFALAFAIAIG